MSGNPCCFSGAHKDWGGPKCEGPAIWEEKAYYRDGTSRFICDRHYQLNRYGLLKRHHFVASQESVKVPKLSSKEK